MDEQEFWDIIELAKNVPDGEKAAVVKARLQELSTVELTSFAVQFSERLAESYSWPLWGAAYIMEGGCSDDAFDYFRGWLITQGRDVFRHAVTDPDSLAGYVNPDGDYFEIEDALGMAESVYRKPTGRELEYEPVKLRAAYRAGPKTGATGTLTKRMNAFVTCRA